MNGREVLWVSAAGRVTCNEHGGEYLRAACQRHPRAREHLTPLDSWLALPADLARAEGLYCQYCQQGRERCA